MDISNRALGLLLVAAIVISIGGTVISLNKLDGFSTTGYATNNQTGTVSLQIEDALSIFLTDNTIDFGTCTMNTTTGYILVDSQAKQADCTWGADDTMTVQNDGNVNANLQIRLDEALTADLGTGNNDYMRIKAVNGTSAGCDSGLQSTYTTSLSTSNSNVCSNLTSLNNGVGTDVNVYAQLWLNETTDTGTHSIGWIFEAIAN